MKKILAAFLLFLVFSVKAQPVIKNGLETFIQENLVYPEFSLKHCIQGKVNISFKVNLLGEVYTSKVTNGPGIDLDQEALRLIRLSSGQWQVPPGYDTTYVLIAPVNFKVSGDDCNNVSITDVRKSIAAYQADNALTDVIINFYRNKAEGKYSEAEEARINAMKKELGYDDEYLQRRIEAGKKKLKQKDKQGACEDFLFVKNMGSSLADELLVIYCK
ncbi:energy transducer TonB [Pedobacter cryoconitis]|uniref:TonB C-terminal domain-containing protein n=1 Tax=Pedobacter cryoconitis TaxID=188932 RepID=A0A7X0J9I7_9SPHI|nr:energy transducer TonB [Pedobacter cryoconitis]MBB6502226.1 hypothetical protein [Pedobacter cryoconitis]